MRPRAAVYLRSSPQRIKELARKGASPLDLAELEKNAAVRLVGQRRWILAETFLDTTKKPRRHETKKRPGLDQLVEGARAREFDIVVVESLDVAFGSLHELVVLVDLLRCYDVHFVSASDEVVDTTKVSGELLHELARVFVGFEQTVRLGRQRLGLEFARSRKRVGRPRTKFPLERALQLRAAGVSLRSIAGRLGVAKSVVERAFARELERELVPKPPIH